VARLRKQLTEYAQRPVPLAPTPVTETDRERFESLGYVGVPGTAATPDGEPVRPADHVQFVERYRAAVRLARSGDARAALDAYRGLTREQPQMPDLWMHLARTAARSERHDVALDAFARALELEPGNIAAHLGAATSNLRARRLDDAAAQAQAVLDDANADAVQSAEAHETLARVALNRHELDLARSEADEAERADPNRPVRALVDGRIALDQARYGDAVEAFERALAAATRAGRAPLSDLRVYAADALARVERTDDADTLLRAELNAFPANVRARTALQSLYRATGRGREAAQVGR
jgi:tetratricopeptide (TPR) repeat protein